MNLISGSLDSVKQQVKAMASSVSSARPADLRQKLAGEGFCPRYNTHKYIVEKMNTTHGDFRSTHTCAFLCISLNSSSELS
jgi:hypothetical protein